MIRSMTAVQRGTFFLVAALAVTAFGTAAAQEAAPDMQAMMAAATPGPHHAQLAKRAGSWKTHSTMHMGPDQPPMQSTGTAVLETVMDGRFVQEITKAPMMGMPWEGRGIYGYDNARKKHISTWYDSFGTMIMQFEGDCEGNCKTVTTKSNYFDPGFKTMKTMKAVSVMNGPNKATLTLFDVAKDGKETKIGEIVYTRDEGQAKR